MRQKTTLPVVWSPEICPDIFLRSSTLLPNGNSAIPQNNTENTEHGYNAIAKFKDGQQIRYAGIITSIKKKYTKNNKIMAFVTIEDLYGSVEIIVFESAYMKSKDSLIEENIVIVDGRLSIREDDATTIIANEIKDFKEQKKQKLVFDISDLDEEKKAKLRGGICYFSGDKNNMQVFVKIADEEKSCGAIYVNDKIISIFREIIGIERVMLTTEE